MVSNNCDWAKGSLLIANCKLTIFYGIFSTFQNARRASRIAHHASCTLNDASLALQRNAELRRLALVPGGHPSTKTRRPRGNASRPQSALLRAPRAIFLLALFFIIIIGDFA